MNTSPADPKTKLERARAGEGVWMRVAPTWASPALAWEALLGSIPRPPRMPSDMTF